MTTDLRLNEPRYVTLPNIMKVKKKPIEVIDVAELGVDIAPRMKTLRVSEPPRRAARVIVPDVDALAQMVKSKVTLNGGPVMTTSVIAEHDKVELKALTFHRSSHCNAK